MMIVIIPLIGIEMTPFEFFKTKNKNEIETLCQKSGTTVAYFEQIARGYSNASIRLGKLLVENSNGDMTLQEVIPALRGM